MTLNVLDLFSGIGGFSLGLERTGGFQTVAFCEIEPFPRAVLKEHWPDVPCYEDVRTLTADQLRSDGIAVDVICGGFPCQDISYAGGGAGLEGARSGLWSEIARLVSELRPQYVIVENVSALLSRGLGRVLGDLAEIGYDAEWHCIPASAVGAPHRRDRIWIIAYPKSNGRSCSRAGDQGRVNHSAGAVGVWPESCGNDAGFGTQIMDNAKRVGCEPWRNDNCQHDGDQFSATGEDASILANSVRLRSEVALQHSRSSGAKTKIGKTNAVGSSGPFVADACSAGLSVAWPVANGPDRQQSRGLPTSSSWWRIEPDVGRVANGVPFRVDRLKGLGNAVVPQVVELIGRAILQARAA